MLSILILSLLINLVLIYILIRNTHTIRDLKTNLFNIKIVINNYSKLLYAFNEIKLVLDNMLAEINGEQLNTRNVHESNVGPWDIYNLREVLKKRKQVTPVLDESDV